MSDVNKNNFVDKFCKIKNSNTKKINKHNLIRQIEIVFHVLIVTTEKIIFIQQHTSVNHATSQIFIISWIIFIHH